PLVTKANVFLSAAGRLPAGSINATAATAASNSFLTMVLPSPRRTSHFNEGAASTARCPIAPSPSMRAQAKSTVNQGLRWHFLGKENVRIVLAQQEFSR